MPRPRKCRRVCAMPENQGFEPLGKQGKCCGNKIVKMSIDEYELFGSLIGKNSLRCSAQSRWELPGLRSQAFTILPEQSWRTLSFTGKC